MKIPSKRKEPEAPVAPVDPFDKLLAKHEDSVAKTNPVPEPVVDGPLWDLYRDGITQSMLMQFLTCREKFRLNYKECLRSAIKPSAALEFGNFIHDVLDYIYSGYRDTDDKTGFINDLPIVIDKAVDEYYDITYENMTKFDSQNSGLEALSVHADLCKGMLPVYHDRYKEDWDVEWVDLEKVFNVIWKKNGRTVRVRGKLDGVFRRNGKLWLFETKTKGQIQEETLTKRLPLDLQVNIYMLAMAEMYGEAPGGVLYNVIKRPLHKRKQGETISAFAARASEAVREDPDKYFLRIEAPTNSSELRQFSTTLDEILLDLCEWNDGGVHYRNPAACSSGIWPCEYLDFCATGSKGLVLPRRKMFSELTNIPLKLRG